VQPERVPDPALFEDQELWTEAWRRIGRARRKRIKAAIVRGLPLDDAVEAAIAIGKIKFTRALWHQRIPFLPMRAPEGGFLDAQLENALENNMAVVLRAWEQR